MKTIEIKIEIPQTVAVACGVARYGETAWPLTDEQLAEIDEGERAEILESKHLTALRGSPGAQWSDATSTTFVLTSAPATWPTVRAAIAAARSMRVAASARDRKAREATIAKILATPASDWITPWTPSTIPALVWGIAGVSLRGTSTDDDRAILADPRVAPRLEEAQREVARLAAIWTEERVQAYLARTRPGHHRPDAEIERDPRVVAHRERLDAAEEAAKAAAEAAKEKARAELRDFASRVDDLARAAAEGYEVAAAVVDHVVSQIERAVASVSAKGDVETIVEGSPAWDRYGWEERKAPRATVLAARDRVVAAVTAIERPSCVDVDVERVMRVDVEAFASNYDEPGEDARKFTGVIVRVSSLVTKDRAIIVPLE